MAITHLASKVQDGQEINSVNFGASGNDRLLVAFWTEEAEHTGETCSHTIAGQPDVALTLGQEVINTDGSGNTTYSFYLFEDDLYTGTGGIDFTGGLFYFAGGCGTFYGVDPTAPSLYSNNTTTSSTTSVVSGITAAAGDLIVLMAGNGSSEAVTSVADGGSNTYTVIDDSAEYPNSAGMAFAYTIATTALSSDDLTVTFNASVNRASVNVMVFSPSGGTITITPSSGVGTSEAIGTVTINPGSINISGVSAITSNEAIGTLTTAASVSPTGVTSSEALGTISTTVGGVARTATGIASQEAVGAVSATLGGIAVPTLGVASSEALGTITVAPQPVTLQPTGIVSGEAIGTLDAIEGIIQIQPLGIASTEAIGSATSITTTTISSVGGIPSVEVVSSATIAFGGVTTTATSIPSSEQIGTITFTSTTTIQPTGLSGGTIGTISSVDYARPYLYASYEAELLTTGSTSLTIDIGEDTPYRGVVVVWEETPPSPKLRVNGTIAPSSQEFVDLDNGTTFTESHRVIISHWDGDTLSGLSDEVDLEATNTLIAHVFVFRGVGPLRQIADVDGSFAGNSDNYENAGETVVLGGLSVEYTPSPWHRMLSVDHGYSTPLAYGTYRSSGGTSWRLDLDAAYVVDYPTDAIDTPTPTFENAATIDNQHHYAAYLHPPLYPIIPTGITSGESFGTANLTASTAATGIASSEAFGTIGIVQGQTVPVSSITSSEAIGTITTAVSTVVLTPTSIPTGEAFGTTQVLPGEVAELVDEGIVSGEVIGTPTVTTGDITLNLTSIASGEAIGIATSQQGEVTRSITAIPSAETIPSPTIATGGITVSPSGIASQEAIGSITHSTTGSFSVLGIPSEEGVGTVTLQAAVTDVPVQGITSDEAFGTPSLSTGIITLLPTSIGDNSAVGTVTTQVGVATITMQPIASAEVVGTVTIVTEELFITPSGIPSAEAVGTPGLATGEVTVQPTGLISEETIGTSTLGLGTVTRSVGLGIGSEEVLGTPTIVSGLDVLVTGIATSSAIGTPTFTMGGVTINPLGIATSAVVGGVTISGGDPVATGVSWFKRHVASSPMSGRGAIGRYHKRNY